MGRLDACNLLGSWFLGNCGRGQEPETRCPTTLQHCAKPSHPRELG
jgi:hypothetical protein